MFVQSIIFLRRGVYTKTFKGTMRWQVYPKDTKPGEYWFNVIAQMMMSAAVSGLGLVLGC
jgi:hypothetical protein